MIIKKLIIIHRFNTYLFFYFQQFIIFLEKYTFFFHTKFEKTCK